MWFLKQEKPYFILLTNVSIEALQKVVIGKERKQAEQSFVFYQ